MKNIKWLQHANHIKCWCCVEKIKITFALSIQMKALDVEQLKLFEGSGRQIVK